MLPSSTLPLSAIRSAFLVILLTGCVSAQQTPYSGIRTSPMRMDMQTPEALFVEGRSGDTLFMRNLRHKDVSGFDLSAHFAELLTADFDNHTIWPTKQQLPTYFKPELVTAFSLNPGLTIRSAAKSGATALNAGIAIIGPPLLTSHSEYQFRLKSYTTYGNVSDTATTDGTAWAAMTVGKTAGIAFEAWLYYFAVEYRTEHAFHTYASAPLLAALRKLDTLSGTLPPKQQIVTVAMPYGIDSSADQFGDIQTVLSRLRDKGIFVVTPDEHLFGENTRIFGTGHDPLRNPDDYYFWRPAQYWRNDIVQVLADTTPTLYFPLDSRTVASPTGMDDYAFHRFLPPSWLCPVIAACYALPRHKYPSYTPEEFFRDAYRTGADVSFKIDGISYTMARVPNITLLFDALRTSHEHELIK